MTKRKLLSLVLIVGILALLVVGCGQKEPQTATLRLGANPTTGYEWTAEQDQEIFDITSEYVEDDADASVVGAGGTQVFVLTPKEAGTAEVTFSYARSWEEEANSQLKYTLTVDKNMQIKMESAAGDIDGSISTIPEMPEFAIE